MGVCSRISVVVVPLLAFLPLWLRLLTIRTYPVPAKGIVVITGASSGIGLDAAVALDKQGFTVYAGVRKEEDMQRISAEFPSIRPILLDVTKEAQVYSASEKVAADAKSEEKAVVGLVNNAGISRRLPVELEDVDAVRSLFDVNFFGVYTVTQAFLPLLRESQGRIVNVGSVANFLPHPGSSAYSGSKAALKSFTDALRMEVSKWDMSVSILEPGYVKTKILQKTIGENAPWRTADPQKIPLYQKYVDHQEKGRRRSETMADSTEVTNGAIIHALTSPTPSIRYVVANVNGIPSQLVKFLVDVLPERVFDLVTSKMMPV